MKLLVVIHSLQAGGAERVAARLANHHRAAGWEVEVVTFEPAGTDFHRLERGIVRHEIPITGDSNAVLVGVARNARRVRALRRLIRLRKPDVVLSMMTSMNVLLAIAATGLAVRTVGSERIHPPRMLPGRIWQWLRALTYRRLDAVVALSTASARWLEASTGARYVPVIPNPAAWPLPCGRPLLDPARHLSAGRLLLLGVGRLAPQKGFDRLIDAFAAIASRHPGWDLAIVGEGEMRDDLAAQIRSLGLDARVWLPGLAGNIGDWYARAGLYVLSSRFEGFPNTLVEAMAGGVPVIAFDCETGPSDIVRHEVDGLLVPEGDVPALAASLDRLMGDAALRNALGARAIEARTRYAPEQVMGMWTEVLAPSAHRGRGGAMRTGAVSPEAAQ